MAVPAPQFIIPSASSAPNSRVRAAWEEVVTPVKSFLDDVSRRLVDQVQEFEPEIAEYARYALDNQGKQLRPALVALAGGTCGRLTDEHVSLAAIIEMIHLATLVHDDIMDGASLRRGRSTLATRWGNDIAVLVGDCLFAHALKLAAGFATVDVCRAVALSTHVVCAGEILQSHRRRRWNLDRAEYFKVLEMKTAELFALACDLGGRLSKATPDQQATLRRYGILLGTAYQIYDDIIDLYGVEHDAGKSLGTDLAKGKVTLPLLVFFERAPEEERLQMIQWLESWDPSYFVGVRASLDQFDALGESRRTIESILAQARESLGTLPDNPETRALDGLTGFLMQQTASLGV
jgi:octaprenyl-diphosphate synthase